MKRLGVIALTMMAALSTVGCGEIGLDEDSYATQGQALSKKPKPPDCGKQPLPYCTADGRNLVTYSGCPYKPVTTNCPFGCLEGQCALRPPPGQTYVTSKSAVYGYGDSFESILEDLGKGLGTLGQLWGYYNTIKDIVGFIGCLESGNLGCPDKLDLATQQIINALTNETDRTVQSHVETLSRQMLILMSRPHPESEWIPWFTFADFTLTEMANIILQETPARAVRFARPYNQLVMVVAAAYEYHGYSKEDIASWFFPRAIATNTALLGQYLEPAFKKDIDTYTYKSTGNTWSASKIQLAWIPTLGDRANTTP